MKIKLLLISFFLAKISSAQESGTAQEKLNVKVSLQSNHLWRGLIITDKPMLSGEISYALTKDNSLKVGLWGASSLSNETDGTHYKEVNYYIQYSKNNLTIGLWDLYNSRNINTIISSDDIFNYGNRKTAHILDLRTSYRFGKSFPLKLEFDVMLYGGANAAEVFLNNDDTYKSNRYSSYVELDYPIIRGKKINMNAFVGGGFAFNPGHTNKGQSTFLYGNGKNTFDIVNVGFTANKNITISEAVFPIHLTTIWNPSNKYSRIQLGTSYVF